LTPEAQPFEGLTTDAVVAAELPETRHLVDELIDVGDVGVVVGVPESHKTFLATDIAVCVARGEGEVLGCRIERQANVAFVWQDDSTRNEMERVQLYAKRRDLPNGVPVLWILNQDVQLPRDIPRLVETIRNHKIGLLVLDSLYNFTAHLDLKDRDGGKLFAELKARICDTTGCTVLVVDHMPWATETNRAHLRAYGDVFKGAAARFGIYIDAVNGKLYVEARGNNVRGFKKCLAYWNEEQLRLCLVDSAKTEEDFEAVCAGVLDFLSNAAEPQSTSAVRKGAGGRSTTVDSALEMLKERGHVHDLGRNSGTWSGRRGDPRYWKARDHAETTSSQLFGTISDDPGSQAIAGETSARSSALAYSPPKGGTSRDEVSQASSDSGERGEVSEGSPNGDRPEDAQDELDFLGTASLDEIERRYEE
jgi:KaiC/GvpD/RAD55 family RecA-like ATPase